MYVIALYTLNYYERHKFFFRFSILKSSYALKCIFQEEIYLEFMVADKWLLLCIFMVAE